MGVYCDRCKIDDTQKDIYEVDIFCDKLHISPKSINLCSKCYKQFNKTIDLFLKR